MEQINQATTTRTTTRARYTGPSAARIAERIAPNHRVQFERGWFWTVALCHESVQDLVAFRQRPDGDGIDVRCKSAGCSRAWIIRSLEQLTGETIWSAYTTEPRPSTPTSPPAIETSGTGSTGGRSWRLAMTPCIILLVAAPLVLGADIQVVALNAVGLGWAGWLARRVLLGRRRAVAKGGRPR